MHVVLKSLLLFFLSLGGVEMNSAINAQLAKLSLQMSVLSLYLLHFVGEAFVKDRKSYSVVSFFLVFGFSFACLFIHLFI